MTRQLTLRSNPGFVGFNRLFDLLEDSGFVEGTQGFPPHNLISQGEDNFIIELALAGFNREDLDINVENNTLTVSGSQQEREDLKGAKYIHRGIASRAFTRRFALAEHIEVQNATLVDGILTISLVRNVPEALKPKKIEVQ